MGSPMGFGPNGIEDLDARFEACMLAGVAMEQRDTAFYVNSAVMMKGANFGKLRPFKNKVPIALSVGAEVELYGMKPAVHNGMLGQVCRHPADGRWGVQLASSGKPRGIKAKNLRVAGGGVEHVRRCAVELSLWPAEGARIIAGASFDDRTTAVTYIKSAAGQEQVIAFETYPLAADITSECDGDSWMVVDLKANSCQIALGALHEALPMVGLVALVNPPASGSVSGYGFLVDRSAVRGKYRGKKPEHFMQEANDAILESQMQRPLAWNLEPLGAPIEARFANLPASTKSFISTLVELSYLLPAPLQLPQAIWKRNVLPFVVGRPKSALSSDRPYRLAYVSSASGSEKKVAVIHKTLIPLQPFWPGRPVFLPAPNPGIVDIDTMQQLAALFTRSTSQPGVVPPMGLLVRASYNGSPPLFEDQGAV